MKRVIEQFFKLKELNTDIRTEVIAGLTTFMIMAYIIFVNPAMISQTGMDFGAAMMATFMQMDILGAMKLGLLSIIFIFLFMDIFDTVGILAGVGELGGFMKHGKLPRAGKAMLTDAVGTCVGAACGTPTVTSYIESAAGIASGGRSGLTSVITGLAFFVALFFYPLIKMIGGAVYFKVCVF